MKVADLIDKLQLKVYTGEAGLNSKVSGAYVSDLLSDVMGHAAEGNVWITLQNHLNVVAIASLRDLPCVILVKNIAPPAEVIEKAVDENIAILGSGEQTFELAGKLYSLLK